MDETPPRVAVLLATHNGSRFVVPQIFSLGENATPFSLHWLDDHSKDGTPGLVRSAARASNIELVEWHQPHRLGVPNAFFQLLQDVEADIYLFCDQDDLWQAGKIDATVQNLRQDINSNVLCFSDPLMFRDGEEGRFHSCFRAVGISTGASMEESRIFTNNPCLGNTVGLTRPLRDLFVQHNATARAYAAMHDWWMYIMAVASGTARMMTNVPTTQYRIHTSNASGVAFSWSGWKGIFNPSTSWKRYQLFRRDVSRQARGFCIASATLPAGTRLKRLLPLARLVATLDREYPLNALLQLARRNAMPVGGNSAWLAAACMLLPSID